MRVILRNPDQDKFCRALLALNRQLIFQWDGVNGHILNQAIAAGFPGLALFDLSHGAGVLPKEWPEPLKNTICGYAGGLGPDNLASEIVRILAKVKDRVFWIDMETRVRSITFKRGDVFDLDKVRVCLEIAQALGAGM